jgi:hypothetical protein
MTDAPLFALGPPADVAGDAPAERHGAGTRPTESKPLVVWALRHGDTKGLTPAEVVAYTDLSAASVRQLLRRMADAGEITKPGRGRYCHNDVAPPVTTQIVTPQSDIAAPAADLRHDAGIPAPPSPADDDRAFWDEAQAQGIVVAELQDRVAVYTNRDNLVVIRRAARDDEDTDPFILISFDRLQPLIDELSELRKLPARERGRRA